MSRRTIILLLVALLLAAVVAIVVRGNVEPAPTPEVVEDVKPLTRILVAKRNVPLGSFVKTAEDLQWAEWDEAALTPEYIVEGTEDMASFQGSVVRRSMQMGEPVIASGLVKPGAGGFLSAVLEPGMRAVSIAVSAITGTAGFIFPGDKVDLIVTHRIKVQETEQSGEDERIVSSTFARDVRVVAVDQSLDNPENKAMLAKTVTVEVSPSQAEQIGVAEQMGAISFALRSLGNAAPMPVLLEGEIIDPFMLPAPAPEHNITSDADISDALNRNSNVTPRILVIRGDQRERREFYRGQ